MDDPLTRFLDRLEPPSVEVPEAVDRRILGHARWVLLRRRMMPVLAVAAVLLVAVTFGWQRYGGRSLQPGDVDGDGSVNIVDAYVLAVRLRDGSELDRTWDLDGDGHVDERDIEVLGKRSVALR